MFLLAMVLGLLSSDDQAVIDAIVKARIELAKPKPKMQMDFRYIVMRERAIKEGKPLIVLVNSDIKQCNEVGCKPIPSNWLIYKCTEFTFDEQVLTTGILVSVAKDKELWCLQTLPDQSTLDQVDKVINPVTTVRERQWVPCPTCPGGRRYID